MSVFKLGGVTAGGTLSLLVVKGGGPVVTRAEVGSTGADDRSFQDTSLTPGPATMPLDPNNSYAIVWSGGFVAAGTATLEVAVADPAGAAQFHKHVSVMGHAGDTFVRFVLVP